MPSSLLHTDIAQIAEGLDARRFSSVDLVEAYLARIDQAKDFRAILETNPDAVRVARELDEERSHTGSRSPLHGVPLLVKDNIVTQDEMSASAGSFALLGAKPNNESSVVRKLRDAGAIILGKTNLSEWSNFRGWDTHSGWSPRGGQALGTRGPESSPGGSSAGSAAAAALGLAAGCLGTETVGSISEPAEYNAVVGLKPTRGLVANDGVIPISLRQDIVGTLTGSVKDAAYLLSVMAGRSDMDEKTWNAPSEQVSKFTDYCQSTDLAGITIGVPRNSFEADPQSPVIIAFELALEVLAAHGAKIVDNANYPDVDAYHNLSSDDKNLLRAADFKQDIALYLSKLQNNPNNLHSADDIIEFTKTSPDEDYPKRDVKNFQWAQDHAIDTGSDQYKNTLEREIAVSSTGGITGALEKYEADVLMVPYGIGITNELSAMLGAPAITVPMGFYPEGFPIKRDSGWPNLIKIGPGMPFSVSFVSKPFSDGVLLKVAYAFEQLTKVRAEGAQPPKLPTAELKSVL